MLITVNNINIINNNCKIKNRLFKKNNNEIYFIVQSVKLQF